MTVSVTLPWPPKGLSPNDRLPRWRVNKIRKSYRETCGWECKAAGLRRIDAAALAVLIIFRPPRHANGAVPDRDNQISQFKAGQDGVVDVIGVDDRHWRPTYRFEDPAGSGSIELRMEPR